MTAGNEHYTTVEAARLLGLAVRSVQLMVDRGELEAWKTSGGHRRISRQSVERWLESRRTAPARAVAASEPGVMAAPAGVTPLRAAEPPPSDAGAPRVLVIDDSVHYQNLVSMVVRRHFPGVVLRTASDGISGLALVGEWHPDVLVVDILLPGIDGATLITSLRSHPQFAHCALVVVTSLDEAQRAPYAFALDGVPVVHKPQLVQALPALLRDLLPVSAAAGASASAA